MIKIANENKDFHLATRNTSYILGILESGHLANLHYGKRLNFKNSYESLIKLSVWLPVALQITALKQGISVLIQHALRPLAMERVTIVNLQLR